MTLSWVQGINLALALIAVAMPFVVYLRTRQSGEHLGTWLSRRENQLLTTLGITLRNARWLTPTLFLRSLLAVAQVSYGLFWIAAVNQRAKVTRFRGETASKFDHPRVCHTAPFSGGHLECFAWKPSRLRGRHG